MTIRKSIHKKARLPQVLGLSAAGVLSFVMAAYWGGAASQDENDVVMPVVRNRAKSEARMEADTVTTAELPTNEPLTQLSNGLNRANSQVTHNPFGGLNLLAGVEMAAGKNNTAQVKTAAKMQKQPPPAPVIEPPPPPPSPPPMAPALPFSIVGGISGQRIAEGQPVAFLRQHDEVFVVRQGDEIGRRYRVDAITAEKIEFTYLPLQQRQVLMMKP